MDMSVYSETKSDYRLSRLQRHGNAIRRNKDVLLPVLQFLNEEPPNASAAREAFMEIPQDDRIAIWSVSTKDGGIWERWERDALKYGDLNETNAYSVWCARKGR